MGIRIRALLLAVASLWATEARADTIVFLDGSQLTGQVVSMNTDQVVVTKDLDGKTLTLARALVAEVKIDGDDQVDSDTQTQVDRPLGPLAGLTADAPLSGRVVFLLDTSGSMAIGDRWSQACAALLELARSAESRARVDVILFGSQVKSLLGKSWKHGQPASMERLESRLARVHPGLTSGTSLWSTLERVLRRHADRIVLLTDGIDTTSAPTACQRSIQALHGATANGLQLDVVMVQSGTFFAEDVEARLGAKLALQTLATAGKGRVAQLKETTEAEVQALAMQSSALPEPRVELITANASRVVTSKLLAAFPQFRVRVLDPTLHAGNVLDIKEYGNLVDFDVIVYDDGDDAVFDQAIALTFSRKGRWLVSNQVIKMAGSLDSRHQRPGSSKRQFLQARLGSRIEIVYHRAGEAFFEDRWIRRLGEP